MANKSTAFSFPEFDVTKILADFKVPGVDVEAILATQRRNIEAVTAANQMAVEGFQALVRRQAEIVRQSMEESSGYVNQLIAAGTPEDKAAKQADLIKAAFEKSLANARELSELIAKSNSDAAEIISRRVSESLDELKAQIAKAKG